jgi:hypothetical protein
VQRSQGASQQILENRNSFAIKAFTAKSAEKTKQGSCEWHKLPVAKKLGGMRFHRFTLVCSSSLCELRALGGE